MNKLHLLTQSLLYSGDVSNFSVRRNLRLAVLAHVRLKEWTLASLQKRVDSQKRKRGCAGDISQKKLVENIDIH